uniref:N-acylethanolamine-hydrolyzing acid amidase-like n=1 Tax=Neolamprologus brichardi TaxID=32507 RepID=A0A3Q4NAB0_NEOBR
MERTTLLLLLLGLAVSCRAQFAPPTVNISLDEDPAVRWMPLAKVFDIDYVNKAAVEVIDPNKFTVSGDQRGTEHWYNWWKNIVSAFLYKRSPVSWLVRETLEEAEDFQDAVMRLSKVPIITGVYYIVGGVRAGEGVVITRDREGPADIWPLETAKGGWFRVETNFDHWLPPPAKDHRREAANKALNATGQAHINMNTLYQVSQLTSTLVHEVTLLVIGDDVRAYNSVSSSRITVYTTVMSAAAPEKYITILRLQVIQFTP